MSTRACASETDAAAASRTQQNQKGTILTCQREFMFTATGQLSKAAP